MSTSSRRWKHPSSSENSAGRDPVARLIGSQAFSALARLVLQTVRVKDTDNRVITVSKSNISLDRGGFAYTIERETKPINKVGEAETFLHEEWKEDARPARELIELARQLGIHVKTLERAQEKRGIVTSKAGKDDGWMWHYPFSLTM